MVSDAYESIGARYENVKDLPFARFAEKPSLISAAGGFRGKSVIDLACGSGFYSRLARAGGAVDVVGVDISDSMIALARAHSGGPDQNLSYEVHDVAELPEIGSFDLAIAAYLFNYANSPDVLRRMCARIADNLAVNGKLIHVGVNPKLVPEPASRTRQFGYSMERVARVERGWRVRAMAYVDPPISFENHFFDEEVYEEVLRGAGFSEPEYVPLTIDEEAVSRFGKDFWKPFLANGPIAVIRATLNQKR